MDSNEIRYTPNERRKLAVYDARVESARLTIEQTQRRRKLIRDRARIRTIREDAKGSQA